MGARLTFVLALVAATVMTSRCLAQRHGGFGGATHFGSGFRSGRNGSPFFNRRRSDFPGAYLLGNPLLWYGDDPAPQPTGEGGPPVLILRPETTHEAKLTPLVIELEGDRYVRHGGAAPSAQGEMSREPRTTPAPTTASSPVKSAPLSPTVLIFQDGHREQVPDYAIVGRVMYAHDLEDGQPGYGMKNIQLSTLDIPATVRANRENGVSFVLPSGPNEVVTRP